MPTARSRALPAAGLVVAALPLLALAATPAQAAVPGAYTVVSQTAAVLLSAQQNPPLGPVTNELVQEAVGYTASSLDSGGGSEAAAAAFYPGNLVSTGPGLLCSEFLQGTPAQCPTQPPAYPLLADAQYPSSTSATAPASGPQLGGNGVPVTVTPAASQAQAGQDANSASTAAGKADVLAGTPAAVSIGAVASSAATSVDATGVHVRVATTLSDVTIGGSLYIRALHSTDTVTVQEGQRPVDHPSVTLSGVTVAGQAATIDSSGIHVAGHDGPALVNDLAAQGLDVHLVGVSRQDTVGVARSSAFGLAVTQQQTVSGAPSDCVPLPTIPGSPVQPPCPPDVNREYDTVLTLGDAGVVALANNGFSFALPAFGVPTGAGGLGSPLAGAAGTSLTGSAGGVPALAGATGTPASGGRAPAVAAPRRTGLSLLSVNLSTLTLALAVGTAAMFLIWRAATVAALHRRSP